MALRETEPSPQTHTKNVINNVIITNFTNENYFNSATIEQLFHFSGRWKGSGRTIGDATLCSLWPLTILQPPFSPRLLFCLNVHTGDSTEEKSYPTHRLQELHPATVQARAGRHQKIRLNRVQNTGTLVLGGTESLSMESEDGDHNISGPQCTKRVNLALQQWQRGIKEKITFNEA